MNKRTKRIEIAVTDDEYQQLKNKKTKARLAEWLRELGLEQPEVVKKKADPDLLIALAKIGANMNQIARVCHTRRVDRIKAIQILLELEQINLKLIELTDDS